MSQITDRIKKYENELKLGKYVYVVKCGEYYKIGITSNLDNRMNSLQCGNPYDIELVYAFRVKMAKELEHELHKQLIDFKHKREWFILPSEFIDKLKNFLEDYDKS